jgi:hypothetical protein
MFLAQGGGTADESGSDALLIGAAVLLPVLFTVIGARGRRRTDSANSGARAAAVAGVVIAVTVVATLLLADNLFLAAISQQPGRLAAFHASGASSMRAFVNAGLEGPIVFLLVFVPLVGALFGEFGDSIVRDRATTGLRPARR